MARRIIMLLDGTWNDADIGPCDTNIVRLRTLIAQHLWNAEERHSAKNQSSKKVHGYSASGKEHIVFYERGVGTGPLDRFRGGTFGDGLDTNIRRAYKFLSYWYEPGDEIFIFGFSRGAYTARSLVGYLGAAGLLRRDYCTSELEAEAWNYYRTSPNDRMPGVSVHLTKFVHDQEAFRIALVGVFDTVGALGVPLKHFRRENREKYEFHGVELSSIVDVNLHALAIDEHREPFEATLWRKPPFKKYNSVTEQVWFPGAHSDVGGSYIVEETRAKQDPIALDDVTLAWMIARTKHFCPDFPCGLLNIDPSLNWSAAKQHEARQSIYRLLKFALRSIANLRAEAKGRFQTEVSSDRHAVSIGERVRVSAIRRLGEQISVNGVKKRYEPSNLIGVIENIAQTYKLKEGLANPEMPVVGWDNKVLEPPGDVNPCHLVGTLLRDAEKRLGANWSINLRS